ncbi:MAG: amphi-Trp domain-containing protein [Halobacteriales archaeon]|nr:amphi-Trp domain-containing protein [Halobacteriales archaeon]
MPEEILFESESTLSREEIAAYLRTVADRLDADGEITLEAGGQSVSLTPPARPTFEVKVERETPRGGGTGELSIEFELEWREGNGEDGPSGDLSIS